MEQSRIQAVHHVDLEAPLGPREDYQWFYGAVVQLEEVACEEADPSQMCFKSKQIELRIHFVSTPQIDPLPLRVTVGVSSLSEAIERLGADIHGVESTPARRPYIRDFEHAGRCAPGCPRPQ